MPSILIMGESGSGKTTSMEKLDPATTFYIDTDKKGLSWKGWRKQYNEEINNYFKTDTPAAVLGCLKHLNEDEKLKKYKVVVIDTLNGIMVAEDMRKTKEKGYDKWNDLAQSIYDLIDYALTVRDDLTVIFTAHTQTDHDDNGYLFTKMKTSGRKLDKICVESKFSWVLLCKTVDGKHEFETQANFSTAKSPKDALPLTMDNDVTQVLKAMKDY